MKKLIITALIVTGTYLANAQGFAQIRMTNSSTNESKVVVFKVINAAALNSRHFILQDDGTITSNEGVLVGQVFAGAQVFTGTGPAMVRSISNSTNVFTGNGPIFL